ncbi:FG-GAP-like repeat-containing protein [Lysobacter sp. Hz 25]|uniref:FG-GAP-like repeat-containing protein n=1 Tax=Lysobacter sp. Hz 25 TaxID=3383698 RepID=UPI0038D50F92
MRNWMLLAVGALCAAFSCDAPGAIINSIAGGGSGGSYATRVALTAPKALAVASGGEIYLVEQAQVRRIAVDGRTRIVAGTGTAGYGGDDAPATEAMFNGPTAIAVDRHGIVYIADTLNQRIRAIGTDGIVRTVAGTGVAGPASDGIATASTLNHPAGLAVGPDGLLYIADTRNNRIRRLNADGTLVVLTAPGEAGAPVPIELSGPTGLAFDGTGALYVAETGNERVRRIGSDGALTTVAGGGSDESTTDAGNARLNAPRGVAVDASGNVFVLETGASRARKIKAGAITPVAGRLNMHGLDGDGGEGFAALMDHPQGMALDGEGNLYIADTENGRIRKLALAGRGLPRVAGSTFLPYARVAVPVAANPIEVEIGDVTGDGRDDVVVLTAGPIGSAPDLFKVLVYAREAGGSLAAPYSTAYYLPQYGASADLALADLNGDGIQDIVVGVTNAVSVFLGNRDRALVSKQFFVPTSPGNASSGGSLAVMDVNRDGRLDVVHLFYDVTMAVPKNLHVLPGIGDGGLGAAVPIASAQRTGVELSAADVSGDGIEDLLLIASANQAYVLEHDGIGGFKPEQSLGSNIAAVQVGDFDDDAIDDMVLMQANHPHGQLVVARSSVGSSERIAAPVTIYGMRTADLNGDHRDDLMMIRMGQLAVYQQSDFGLSEEVTYPAPGGGDFAVGDVNGDGCKDVVAVSITRVLYVYYGQGCTRFAVAPSDVEGNGKSDLLWRDDSRQHLALWKMDGATRIEGVGHAVSPDQRVLATGDFHGDGKLDLLWTDGMQMQLWEGLGDGQFRGVPMRDYPTGWRVVAAGDVNGDGRTDLLWRNDANTAAGLWVMQGAQIIDSAAYPTSPDWWVAGSGDFSGDGRLDLVWTDGNLMQLWRATTGLRFVGDAMPAYPQGWELTATGDVTGDGMADLMWRHPEQGHFAVWAMDGGVRLRGFGYQPGPAWRVAQTGDFSGDGRTDIVWTNGSLMQLWQSQGDGFIGIEMPGYPSGWSVIRR